VSDLDIAHLMVAAGTSPSARATDTATAGVTFVNQAPSFVRGGSQSILNTAALRRSQTGRQASARVGSNEAGQVLNSLCRTTNNPLFTVQPSIDPATGTLTYTRPPGRRRSDRHVQYARQRRHGQQGHDTSAAQNVPDRDNASRAIVLRSNCFAFCWTDDPGKIN